MNTEVLYQELLSAVSLSGQRAVLRVVATYQAAGGVGAKVFPPTYPTVGDRPPYVIEERMVDGQVRKNVLLDSTPSQANRVEEALLRAHRGGVVQVPLMTVEHTGAAPVTLTSLEFPHRYADAYLRDSLLDGTAFDRTELGRSLMSASLEDARALYAHDPGSLVFGAWNSHRKGRQRKFPRVYASEVIGWDPVVGARSAGRLDPLNLQGAQKPSKDGEGWDYSPAATKTKGEKLSEIGHGNVAPNSQHGGVTISCAQRTATLSLAGLDRIGFGLADKEAAVAARAVLAAYAIMADRLAFGGPTLWLRSGCELVLESERLEWVNRGGGTEQMQITTEAAVDLFKMATRLAGERGIGLSEQPVRLTPSKPLAQAIDFSLTKATADDGQA
jgi:CRISPR-associated protein Csb1